jgi:hypothetical protein
MTTTQAGITAYAVVIAWAIVMLMLLRWALANAAMQAAQRRAEQEDAAERARAAAYWASPEGQQRKAQMDAEQRWYERQVSATATKPASQWSVTELDSWWHRVEPVRPTFSPAPVQPQPVYIAPPAYDLPRPVVQPKPASAPVPAQPPGILVPNWPTPERVRTEARK